MCGQLCSLLVLKRKYLAWGCWVTRQETVRIPIKLFKKKIHRKLHKTKITRAFYFLKGRRVYIYS